MRSRDCSKIDIGVFFSSFFFSDNRTHKPFGKIEAVRIFSAFFLSLFFGQLNHTITRPDLPGTKICSSCLRIKRHGICEVSISE